MRGHDTSSTKSNSAHGNDDATQPARARDMSLPDSQQINNAIFEQLKAKRLGLRTNQPALFKRLQKIGVSSDQYVDALQRSNKTGATLVQELVASKAFAPDEYYREVARELGVEFVVSINPQTILSDMNSDLMEQGSLAQIFGRGENGLSLLYVAPDLRSETLLLELLERCPEQKKRIRICAPDTILAVTEIRKSQARLDWAVDDLSKNHPDLSAKHVLAPWQAYFLGAFCVGLPIAFYSNFQVAAMLVHLVSTVLFSCVVGIRIAALRALKRRKSTAPLRLPPQFPRYSVLTALHKEAGVAGQLVQAMSALDWPASRLEVLYVCEADDHVTIDALVAHGFPANHRIVRVPPCAPRTKPKALNFALGACKGEYVVIYDAEDRPHPLQLKEAWTKFANADENLACVQAPLVVTNAQSSWLSLMFAFEYAAHFKGLLPYLAEARVPLPLGGTSNHFRKAALEKVGGWDPYNVTEDADLGLRFYRFGYSCDVINLPTLEDAPEMLREWLPQRTRWQKGWMQTFLVHNRNAGALFAKLGSKGGLHFEVLIAGFILSPLLFVTSLIAALHSLYYWQPVGIAFTIIDAALIVAGYICALLIGFGCTENETLKNKGMLALTLPAYWLLLSVAAWRAVYQLVVKPHLWEKTPHRPTKSPQETNPYSV